MGYFRRFLVLALVVVPLASVFASGQKEAETAATSEIVVAIGAEPEALDPIAMASAPSATVSEHMTQSLVYLAPNGELVPALATDWEAASDGMSWTLTLREGVTFHDGEPFNAQAVKQNLDRFIDPDSGAPYAFLLSEVESIEVVSEYEVRLNLSQQFAPIISHLSHSFIGMLSPAQLDELDPGETISEPIGTGPYELVEWQRGEQIVMERNEEYWGEVPEIERAVFRFITEDAARVVALETGEADAIMRVPPADAQRLNGNDDIEVVYPDSVRVIYIGFNTQVEPFDDPRVRRALNYAVNKEAIVNNILQGSASVSDAPVVSAVFGHESVGPYEYDPDRARELLAEAGYPDGFSFTLHHPTGRYLLDSTVAEAVQSMLAEVGVEAQLQTREWSAYLEYLRQDPGDAEHDAYLLGWGTVTLDSDYGLYPLLHSSQWASTGWNVSYYENDSVDELLTEARVNPNRGEREELYAQAMETIWNDAPWIFLHNEAQINAYRSNVEGLIHHPLENLLVWDAEFTN